jgi:hypothetical protein
MVCAWINLDNFGAPDGGRITGPIYSMFDKAWFIWFLAMLLTFVYRRIASILGFTSVLLCLPFYLYVIAPGPFRSVFPGEYKVPLQSNFVWDTWAVAGMLTLAVAVFVSVRSFSGARHREIPARTDNM